MQKSSVFLLVYPTGRSASINADSVTRVRFSILCARFSELIPSTDYIDVANVISNYSAAGIPLETMWTDIGSLSSVCVSQHLVNQRSVDYMDRRRIFTVDPDYFPLDRMREIISYLHDHDQKFSMQLSLSP